MSSNNHRRCAKSGKTRAEDMAITYYRFPKPGKLNIIKAQSWAKYCWPTKDCTSLESLHSLYSSNKVLCGRHFSTPQFYDSKRQKLSIYAVPDIIEPHHSFINQENDLNQIDNQTTVMQLQQEASTSITQIENVDEQISKKDFLLHTSTNTSKPTITEENAVYVVETTNSGENVAEPHSSSKTRKGILSFINMSKLRDMSPRELTLYKICQKKIKEIMRLRKNLKKKKVRNVLKTLTEEENVQELCNLNMSNNFAILLQSQIKNWL